MDQNQDRKMSVDYIESTQIAEEDLQEPEIELIQEEQQEEIAFDEDQVFEWEADEFEYHNKDKNWILYLIGGVVLVSVIFGLMQQWAGVALAIIMGVVVYMYAFVKPKKIHLVITKDGLLMGEKLYPTKEMKSFWINNEGILFIEHKNYWPNRTSVLLDSVDVVVLEDFLSHFIKKEDRKDREMADKISKWLKM